MSKTENDGFTGWIKSLTIGRKMMPVKGKKAKKNAQKRKVTPNLSIKATDIPPSPSPFAMNRICTSKYTWLTIIPKNLWEQFHRYANIYFLVVQVINWLPGINVFVREVQMIPLLFVLLVTMAKDWCEDRQRHRSDYLVNNLKCRRYDKDQRRFVQVEWKKIRVGDVIHLSCDEKVPADILLLKSKLSGDENDEDNDDNNGVCYVETANLDGESSLKQRYAVPKWTACRSIEEMNFEFVVECEKPNMLLHKFYGNIVMQGDEQERIPVSMENMLLRDSVLKNSKYVEGLVLYAGHETKAMLNNRGPSLKQSRLERMMNGDIVWCVMILIVMCTVGALGRSHWLDQLIIDPRKSIPFLTYDFIAPYPALEFLWTVLSFIILFQMIIPISLYVCIEMVKIGQVYYIRNDENLYDATNGKRIECRATNITEDLGQVEYIFSDKTGTLTENMMKFRCCTIGGVDYVHEDYRDHLMTYEQSMSELKRKSLRLHKVLKSKLDEITLKYTQSYKHDIVGLKRARRAHRKKRSESQLPSNEQSVRQNGSKNSKTHSESDKEQSTKLDLTDEQDMIRDFFLVLAICNTAMAAEKNTHKDNMNAKGDSEMQMGKKDEKKKKSKIASVASYIVPADWSNDKKVSPIASPNAENGKGEPPPAPQSSQPSINFETISLKNIIESSNKNEANIGDGKKDEDSEAKRADRLRMYDLVSEQGFKATSKASRRPKPIYESESPDEVALVTAAFKYKIALLNRSKTFVKVMMPNGMIVTYHVLMLLPFDNDRKRMSIIVRCPLTGQIVLFCKGSDSTVLSNVRADRGGGEERRREFAQTEENLTKYSSMGFRILCIARRVLSEKQFLDWHDAYQKAVNQDFRDREDLSEEDSNDNVRKNKKAKNRRLARERRLAACINEIESDLELLGATAIEDRLQYGVPDVIASLKAAGIVFWVLTGDKMETAINIANSCSLFNDSMQLIKISPDCVKSKATANQVLLEKIAQIRKTIATRRKTELSDDTSGKAGLQQSPKSSSFSSLRRNLRFIYDILNWQQKIEFTDLTERARWGLVIDGASLNFVIDPFNLNLFIELTQYCSSVLCCRMTPSQKAAVVKCVKRKLNSLTMAVGDGANDVAMIQTANVGVGISGLEGTQAVMASDFAISKFHHLERLILVHGNLCYNRLATTILYFFYKNTLVIFAIFLFQFSCAFSGQSELDDVHLLAVNVFYTTLPAMTRGIFERDYNDRTLLRNPALYERGRNSTVYSNCSFWVNTTDSIYQSLIIYYFTYFTFRDSSLGIFEFGLLLFTVIIITNLAQIAMETKYWNKWYCGSFVLSLLFYFVTVIFFDYSLSKTVVSSIGSHNYKLFYNILLESKFWMLLIIVPVTCLMPRAWLRVVQETVKPQFRV